MKKLVLLCVLVFTAPCCGSSLFEFDGSFRDGTPVSGELTLDPDSIMLEIAPVGGGVTGVFSNADFVRFTEFDGEFEDTITLSDFDGPVGGTITIVGELLPAEADQTIMTGVLALWDDGVGFSGQAEITSWKSLPVPEPKSMIAGSLGFLLAIGAYSAIGRGRHG